MPAGLEGVVVAETTIGDVRGQEGFFHYRQYSAVDLAETRSLEDVWHLLFRGELPDAAASAAFAEEVRRRRAMPPGLSTLLPALSRRGAPLDVLRTAVSVLGAELGWRPTHDIGADELSDQAVGLCAVVPTILAAAHRLRQGDEPVEPRDDLGFAANYLYMLTGDRAEPAARPGHRAVHDPDHRPRLQRVDVHGARGDVDRRRPRCGHRGRRSARCRDRCTAGRRAGRSTCSTPSARRTGPRPTSAHAVEDGERIMGFGHRVYKTDDPRSLLLRSVTERLGGPLVEFSQSVERTTVDVLAELKPGRQLYTNVEFYAGVVMHTCGIPREMFTPTFAAGRTIGWCTHVMEQAAHNRLIRPAARYVGPPPPQPVPPAGGLSAGDRGRRPAAASRQNPTNLVRVRRFGRRSRSWAPASPPRGRTSRVRALFSFPDPVNEVSARLVAAGRRGHVRADDRLRPRVGHRRHRLRLRGPGAHGTDAQPARPAGDAGRHAPAGRAGAPGARSAQALRPGDGRRLLR